MTATASLIGEPHWLKVASNGLRQEPPVRSAEAARAFPLRSQGAVWAPERDGRIRAPSTQCEMKRRMR